MRREVLSEHVVVELESIGRMYLNVYVPQLQRAGQVAGFLIAITGSRSPRPRWSG